MPVISHIISLLVNEKRNCETRVAKTTSDRPTVNLRAVEIEYIPRTHL